MGIASEYRRGPLLQSGRRGVKKTSVPRRTQAPFVCSSVMWWRRQDGVCSLRWWRVIKNWQFFFVFLSELLVWIKPRCQGIQNSPSPNRRVRRACTNSLHALRFRCQRLIAYGYYGACACTGITVITRVHGESKRSLRFRRCHFPRIALSHDFELPHPQMQTVFINWFSSLVIKV